MTGLVFSPCTYVVCAWEMHILWGLSLRLGKQAMMVGDVPNSFSLIARRVCPIMGACVCLADTGVCCFRKERVYREQCLRWGAHWLHFAPGHCTMGTAP
jgi:hypothetical protein